MRVSQTQVKNHNNESRTNENIDGPDGVKESMESIAADAVKVTTSDWNGRPRRLKEGVRQIKLLS